MENKLTNLILSLIGSSVEERQAKVTEQVSTLLDGYEQFTVDLKGHNGKGIIAVSEAFSEFRWFPRKDALHQRLIDDFLKVIDDISQIDESKREMRMRSLVLMYFGRVDINQIDIISTFSDYRISCKNCDDILCFSLSPQDKKVVLKDFIEPCSVKVSDLTDKQEIHVPSGKLAFLSLDEYREYVPQEIRKKAVRSKYSLSTVLGIKALNKALAEAGMGSIAMHHDCHTVIVSLSTNKVTLTSSNCIDEGDVVENGDPVTVIGQGIYFMDIDALSEITGESTDEIAKSVPLVLSVEPGKYQVNDLIRMDSDDEGLELGSIELM